MSEELKISVGADTSSAKTKIDNLVKEYNSKKEVVRLDVKFGDVDVNGLNRSISNLTGNLEALTNIRFDNLKKLETTLKNINQALEVQATINNKMNLVSNANSEIKEFVKDREKAVNELEGLKDLSSMMQGYIGKYNKEQEKAFKDFSDSNKESLKYITSLESSSTSKAFKNVLDYKKKIEDTMQQISKLGVTLNNNDKVINLKGDEGNKGIWKGSQYVDLLGMSAERFEVVVEQAKELNAKVSSYRQSIEKNMAKVTEDERAIIRAIDETKKKLIPVNNDNDDLKMVSSMLRDLLPEKDLKDLDFAFDDDILKGYERFVDRIKNIQRELMNDAGETSYKFDLFEDLQDAFSKINNLNLEGFNNSLNKAFDLDGNVISKIQDLKIVLEELNKLSIESQKALFSGKSLESAALEEKVKEYLSLDKQINEAFTKLDKAQLSKNLETEKSLNKQIDLLREKQSIAAMELRADGGYNGDLVARIQLQEQLNRVIEETNKAGFRDNYITKLHEEALEINHSLRQIDMDEVFSVDTSDLKSTVLYLDSARDGIKSIITESKGLGKDLTTTSYGDGTQVRKATIDTTKMINQLSQAYKQAENAVKSLTNAQIKSESKGDKNTVATLEKQINAWKSIQEEISDASDKAGVYERVMEKVHSTVLKSQQAIEQTQSKDDFKFTQEYDKAATKIEEFTEKTLSNLQELERKFKGTQLFEGLVGETDRVKSELKGLFDLLESMDTSIDMSKLSSSMRGISQEVTQLKRDFKELDNTIGNEFFDDLYDSMRTFTLGNIIGDAIQNGVYAIKDTIVGLDNALRDIMKVAPTSFRGTAEELKAFKSDAIDVAKSVGQSSEDVIQGTAKALQTGITSMKDALEVARQSSMFANVGDVNQETADKYIVSIMSAYGGMENALKGTREQINGMGQDYSNLTKFTDMANYAGNNFAISTADVGEALTRSGSILSQLGVSMQDSVAMVIGANESIQDSEKVGTALKTIATNLGGMKAAAKDGSLEMNRSAKALKEMAGIDIYSNKQKGEIKDMMTIMTELNGVWDKLSEDKQLAVMEALSGKNHINVMAALMGNWENVVKFQDEYNKGFTVGSAEKENERFLNSIEGKWNALKENMKDIVTTVINSDFAKDALDGAIAFTDILNDIFKSLDKMGIALPATIGLLNSLGGVFKTLATNKSVGGVGKWILDGVFSKGATGDIVNVTKASKDFANTMTEVAGANINVASTTTKASGGLKGMMGGLKNTAAASKLAMVGTSLLNGALLGLASAAIGYGISKIAKHLDEVNNKYKNMGISASENVDRFKEEISVNNDKINQLKNIQSEYDKLNSKTNRTNDESARLKELTKEIAEIMPELVTGYDSEGNPIVRMSGDASDLISKLEQANKLKNGLMVSEQREQASSALGLSNSQKEGEYGKVVKAENDFNMKLVEIAGKRKETIDKLNKADSDSERDKYINELRKLTEEYITIENDYNATLDQSKTKLQEHSNTVSNYLSSSIQGKDEYTKANDEIKESFNGFLSSLDFSEVPAEKLGQVEYALKRLLDLSNKGVINLPGLSKDISDLNKSLADGSISSGDYDKKISAIAEEYSKLLGIDVDVLKGMFNGIEFDTSGLLTNLSNVEKEAVNTINNLMATSDVQLKYEGVVEISNMEELPQAVRDIANEIIKDGVVTNDELSLLYKVLFESDTTNVDKKIEDLNKTKVHPKMEVEGDTSEADRKINNLNKREIRGKVFTVKSDADKTDKKIIALNQRRIMDKEFDVDVDDNASFPLDNIQKKRDNLKDKTVKITVWEQIKKTVSSFFGGGGSGGGEGRTFSMPVESQAMAMDNQISTMADVNSGISTMNSNISTFASGVDKNIVMPSFDFDINIFTKLENAIKKISNSLDILGGKYENAVGKDKIKYLEKQISLFKEQQKLQHDLAESMRSQSQVLRDYLFKNGFSFDKDGGIDNYNEKLLQYEKNLEKLRVAAEKNNATDKTKANYESHKKELDKVKKALSEYINLTFNEIPNLSAEWWDLNNSIKEAQDSIEKINREQKLFTSNNKLIELNDNYEDISNALDMIDAKSENFYGKDKINILKQKVDLLEQQKNKLHEIANAYRDQLKVYQTDLSKFGFTFNKDGNINDIDGVLNKYKNSADYEKIKDLVEEYLDIQNNKIPQASKEWWNLENAIKDTYEEQLRVTKDVEDKIISIYKKQLEEKKKVIDEELDAKLKALNKEKDAYNKSREEQKYKDSYQEQLSTVEELQKKLTIAQRDGSLNGQKKVQDLMKQLQEEQKKLQDLVQDKIDSDVNDFFDSESNRLEEEAQGMKDSLDKQYSDENLQQIVNDVLKTGVFKDLEGNVMKLQDVMLDYVNKYEDGMSAIGGIIKNEWLSNLEIAKDVMKDIGGILNGLDIPSIARQGLSMDINKVAMKGLESTYSGGSNISFNQPLIVVEGNVDSNVLEDLKGFAEDIKQGVINDIYRAMK